MLTELYENHSRQNRSWARTNSYHHCLFAVKRSCHGCDSIRIVVSMWFGIHLNDQFDHELIRQSILFTPKSYNVALLFFTLGDMYLTHRTYKSARTATPWLFAIDIVCSSMHNNKQKTTYAVGTALAEY